MQRLATPIVVALIVTLMSSPARAGGQCPDGTTPQAVDGGGAICIPAADPGGPSAGGNDRGADNGGSGGSSPEQDICDLMLLDPQPPAADPHWQGRSPDDGDLYLCVLPGTGNPAYRFVANSDAAPPSPASLARKALDQLSLTVPDIHLAPAPPAKTYVGLDTWLWVPENQWSVLRKSVSAGSTTVTVSAAPQRVLWNMGAGSTRCNDAGRPWVAGEMSATDRTTCKYVYQRVSDFQVDEQFRVSATITFDVTWQCAGNCLAPEGTLGEVDGLPAQSAIRVGERQSVNTTPDGA